eukprot:TRINITY_DN554_c0_g1_i1.p1 TRINITY_DN554_c0_g1~~TRINITY_DN554_c0_g1_i1.p1  ORF type:complete len:475 (-),score=86.83 TRINITY_DN554_c0_g1_i1:27-1451(-)
MTSAVSFVTAFNTYCVYGMLMLFGYFREFLYALGKKVTVRKGYAPLLASFDHFFTRWMYHRISDCWNRPIASRPGAFVDVLERSQSHAGKTRLTLTGERKRCLNLGSYNYLGFADNYALCTDLAQATIRQYGTSTAGTRAGSGTCSVHVELERTIARYVGKEDAITVGMGFAANATTIPLLVDKHCLIISDALNHASIVSGARLSGASVRVFAHNDMVSLENLIRKSIIEGQPRTRRPWKKILIIVEGIYSMEGDVCNLPDIIRLKQKYRCFLYLDEAHSIGAMGPTGRGIVEHYNVSPDGVDVLMGTFTKSFGSCGGYVAASRDIIAHLRARHSGLMYTTAMTPGCAQQAITALRVMMGELGEGEGQRRLQQLHSNTNYFRQRLSDLGFLTYGQQDSPVTPMMLYNPAKLAAFSRMCLQRGLAVVVVGYPATSIIESRARFCISASHSRKDLDDALQTISEIGDLTMVKYAKA